MESYMKETVFFALSGRCRYVVVYFVGLLLMIESCNMIIVRRYSSYSRQLMTIPDIEYILLTVKSSDNRLRQVQSTFLR